MYQSVAAAHRYLLDQGYDLTEKTLRNHIKAGKIGVQTARNGKVIGIDHKALIAYASAHLDKRGAAAPEASDDRARLLKAQADQVELKVKQLRGNLLDAGEEERRDRAVLLGIRQHLEVAAPDRAKATVALLSEILSDDQRAAVAARLPEIIAADLDCIADCFDRLARAGGVEIGDDHAL